MDRLGVSFQIGQGVSDLWGLEDGLDFRVGHGPLGPLLLVLRAAAHVDGGLGFLGPLPAQFVFRVSLQASFEALQGLVVLLHEEVAVAFLVVGLLEGRVLLENQLVVLFCSLELHQFYVDLADVAVVLGAVGVSAHCFFVLLEGLRELPLINASLPSL